MGKIISPGLLKIIALFLFWRILLIFCLLFALNFIPLGFRDRFLGGGFRNYQIAPELFSWANFDGEHYSAIAIHGYKALEQAFFPIFPALISFFSKPLIYDSFSAIMVTTIVGLIISNGSFLLALIYLWELIRLDYSKKISYLTILVLLLFPTSFYFGSLYNESLFLLLTVLSYLNARKGKWIWAGIFGFFASATRVFGVLLLPALLIEFYQQKKNLHLKALWLFLIPLGLIFYMFYQYLISGDPFAFYNLQTVVGEQHQKGVVLLPQVYFRYIKMLSTADMENPIYQTIILEFFVGIVFFLLPIYGYFKKIRISYLFYALAGFLLPAIQGSFSSAPRYILVLFPSFLAAALIISSWPKFFKITFFIISTLLLCLETILFLRGYWIA